MNEKNKISNFKNGNELDIEKIINEYSNYLFMVVKNACGNYLQSEDIEEIILDVFLALWNNKEKLDETKDIKPYISSIAHNLIKKKMSLKSDNLNLMELKEDMARTVDDWAEVIDNTVTIEKIDYILNDLSEEEYQIFTLFYYYSYKTKEIAKKLDISNMKVKTKLHRIRNHIKKKLKESGYSI